MNGFLKKRFSLVVNAADLLFESILIKQNKKFS